MNDLTIPFTQYVRPDGRKRPVDAPADRETYDLAQQVIAAGMRFECEVLTTGQVSLTVAHRDEDVAIELSPNGPEIDEALQRLVRKAHALIGAER